MNSEYGQLSPEALRARERQARQEAESAVPCVAVTEQNWKGLLTLEKLHGELLTELLRRSNSLATSDDLRDVMGWLTQELNRSRVETAEQTAAYQAKLAEQAEAFTSAAQTAVSDLSKQAGSVSERLSSDLCEEKEKLRRYVRRLFVISLIPAALTLLSVLAWALWLR